MVLWNEWGDCGWLLGFFLWIIFELSYCYNIGLEIFIGSIFYTFFHPPPPQRNFDMSGQRSFKDGVVRTLIHNPPHPTPPQRNFDMSCQRSIKDGVVRTLIHTHTPTPPHPTPPHRFPITCHGEWSTVLHLHTYIHTYIHYITWHNIT